MEDNSSAQKTCNRTENLLDQGTGERIAKSEATRQQVCMYNLVCITDGFLGDLRMEKLGHEKGMQAENRASAKNCQPILMVFEMIYYKFHWDFTPVDFVMALKNIWKTCRQFFTPTVCSQPAMHAFLPPARPPRRTISGTQASRIINVSPLLHNRKNAFVYNCCT